MHALLPVLGTLPTLDYNSELGNLEYFINDKLHVNRNEINKKFFNVFVSMRIFYPI